MAVLQEYKCPCCSGSIAFDSTSQKMKCPYCDTEFELEALAGFQEDMQADAPDDMQWQTDSGVCWTQEEGIQTYVCASCGGEILGDEHTAATRCPYCGNAVVVTGNLAGMLKPDLVIPFKLDKNAAKAAYEKHIKGKTLLPKVFSEQNHIDEIRGIYVPFWLFDADADADIRYKATRTRFWSDSKYDYTETLHFSVVRAGDLRFEAVPADGSSKMPDDLMESIEPFSLEDAVAFQTMYLAGYGADKYDMDAKSSIQRVNERIKKSTEQAFAGTVHGFHSVIPVSSSVRLQNAKARYAFYPVWILNTTWNGRRFVFAMNGQTGKMAGDLPVDKKARLRWFCGIAGIGTALIFGLQYLLWLL